jgi:hypothetical protein
LIGVTDEDEKTRQKLRKSRSDDDDGDHPYNYLAVGKVLLTEIMEGKVIVHTITCHEGTGWE